MAQATYCSFSFAQSSVHFASDAADLALSLGPYQCQAHKRVCASSSSAPIFPTPS